MKKTLYVSRPLLNGDKVYKWFADQGIDNLVPADKLHVTVAFSRKEVDWSIIHNRNMNLSENWPNSVMHSFGEKDIVMKIESKELHYDWEYYMTCVCSYDFEKYQPHISIKYIGEKVDINTVKPFPGGLLFGPEKMEELDLEWRP